MSTAVSTQPGRPSQTVPPPACTPTVAYIVSRFPKLTETFVLYELLAVEAQGIDVELYPLWRERTSVFHPEAKALVERARFQPAVSLPILRAHAHFLRRRPRAYFGALSLVLRANLGSARYFFAALAIFPKVVYFAYDMAGRGVEHVHAHFASHPAAAAFVIQRLTGIPYSFTAHGSDLHRDRHMLAEKVAEASFVVAISDYNRKVIEKTTKDGATSNVIVLHCGVDTEFFRPAAKAAPDPLGTSRPFTILCVGTLQKVKGQRQLIAACDLLAQRGVDFSCELIGDGADRAALERAAESAGIAGRIRFAGGCTRAEVAEALRRADVVVGASVPTGDGRREGIPVALMEAAASGTAVVASRLSGIPELIEDEVEGCLVPPGDVPALADAIERLYRDPKLRERMGSDGRRKVIREFELTANAATLAGRFRPDVDA